MAVSEKSKLASEFLGTFMLVFVVGLNLTTGSTNPALAAFTPTAIACCLMVLVYSMGDISGGHFNPAVTFAVALQKTLDENDKLMPVKYIVSQCLGGALAGLATGFLYGFGGSGKAASLLSPPEAYAVGAPLTEFLYTFLLCFVVLNTAVCDKDGSKFYKGLAIGFVIIAAHGGAVVHAGSFNPAVALGINFMGLGWQSLWLPILAAAEMAGGFAAVTALHLCRPETKHPVDEKGSSWIARQAYKLEENFDPEDTSEFLGTFFIGLTLSLNAMTVQLQGAQSNSGMGWSVAATFMVLVYALGDVSGAVFNPALTLAFAGRWYGTGLGFNKPGEPKTKLCDPAVAPKEMIKYTIAQLLGGAAGTGATILIFLLSGQWPAPDVGPKGKYTLGQAFFAEVCGTFFLCFVILAVASTAKPLSQFHGFSVAGVIVAAGYAFGPISGGLLNPAVTLASSIGDKFAVITGPNALSYMAAQLLGGIIAAVIFRKVTHVHEFPEAEQVDVNMREPFIAPTV